MYEEKEHSGGKISFKYLKIIYENMNFVFTMAQGDNQRLFSLFKILPIKPLHGS